MTFSHTLNKAVAGNFDFLIKRLNQLDPTKLWTVTVRIYQSKRSLEQNNWIRKYARDFGKHFGYEADFAYEMLMFKFNPDFGVDLDGNEIRVAGSFSKLNTKEASDVQDAVLRYGIDNGFYWDGEYA